jgi:hypothetical protein
MLIVQADEVDELVNGGESPRVTLHVLRELPRVSESCMFWWRFKSIL